MIKKADIILIAAILAASFVFIGASVFTKDKGKTAVVSIDGEYYAEYPLDRDITETVVTGRGSNTIVINGGSVSVSEADCPDKYCVSHVAVSREGEIIVCLPHRLTIEIRGDGNG